MTPPTTESSSSAGSYVPDLVRGWSPGAPRHRQVEGSLVSADISGFTALSERLAGYGREGAEELTALLNQCFGGMIEIIDAHGGDVLKFGGDALLVLFTGDAHTARAAAACLRMRRLIERTWSTPLIKRVKLGISQGVHSGTFDLHLVDAGHQELLVVGPGMSATVGCEGAAERGQVLLSHDAAALLDESVLGEVTADGRVLESDPAIDTRAPGTGEAPTGPVEPFVPDWLTEQTEAGRVAEHRVVTVGFVFFGGVDALLAERGPVEVQARLQALATATTDATERHGVFWLASDVYAGGGKIILAAGAPRSTGQDEDAAVRTARAILEADVGLPLRAGLNRGPVFMGDLGSERRRTFTVMGDTVNLAARLMQKSAPGQLVASQAVLEMVPTRFELTPLEPFLVKGKTEPINASLVGAQLDDDTAEVAEAIGDGQIPFVGRAVEVAQLEALLEAARAGHGAVVDLLGEPGIGKTRLVTEIAARHPDVATLRGNGGLYARNTPFFAASTMLRQYAGIDRGATAAVAGKLLTSWVVEHAPDQVEWLPLLAIAFGADVPMTPTVERIDPANRAGKLREVVVDLLTVTIHGPALVIVDEAHRLDEASEDLFAAIGRRIARRPWILVAIRRVDGESFATAADEVVTITLGPLSSDDIAELAAVAVRAGIGADEDDLPDLLRRGVTNPLFLLELMRAGVGAGAATPDSIEALVTARIDTLGAADRLLLREAAVLGSFVDVNLLAEATGELELRLPARWRPLDGFLQRTSDGRYRFEQGLYREVAYGGLSYRRRRQLHADIGSVLERRAGEDWVESSELLSLHFHHAGVWDRSWRYSVIAGDRARSKYANGEAAEFYRRALDVPSSHRPASTAIAAVAESLADALEVDGRFDDADEALGLARSCHPEPDVAVRLLRKSGVIRERQGKYTQALRWYGRGLTTVTELSDDRRRRRAEADLALAYAGVKFRQGRLQDTIRWAHRAETAARELDDPRMLAHASYLLLIGYGVLRRPEVADYRDLPLRLFEQVDDLAGQSNVLNNLGVDAHDEGRWAEALDLYERSRAAREVVGDVIGAATATLNIGEILSHQGHYDDAEPLLETALRQFRRAGYSVGIAVATSYLGRLHARRGEHDTARLMLAEAAERFERMGASHFVLETKVFQLECEVLAGNARAALDVADPLFQLAVQMGDPMIEAMLLRSKSWALFVAGELDEAHSVAEQGLAIAEELGSTYEIALALIMRGRISSARGGERGPDHARARAMLEELGVVQLPRIAGT
jgi:class 3 adenylate cyclase/tetratricopeptide (TPR) repeat protein